MPTMPKLCTYIWKLKEHFTAYFKVTWNQYQILAFPLMNPDIYVTQDSH